MSLRTSAVRNSVVVVLLAALAFTGLAGCGGGAGGTTTSATVALPTSVSSPPTTNTTTSSTMPALNLSPYQKELAATAKLQSQLIRHLAAEQAPPDDPRVALVFGLRARIQALTGRQALVDGDAALTAQAVSDVYDSINRGRHISDSPLHQLLEDAHTIIADLGDPSQDPEKAASLLDEFIAALAPLLAQAQAEIPAGPTTS